MDPLAKPVRRTRLAEDFSNERRLSVADRTKLEQLWNPSTGTVAKLEKEIIELKGWVKWGMGFGAAITLGLTILHLFPHLLPH